MQLDACSSVSLGPTSSHFTFSFPDCKPAPLPRLLVLCCTNVDGRTMQKLSNLTGQARHGWEKVTPAGFMGRPNVDHASIPAPIKRNLAPAPMSPLPLVDSLVNLSFNVPFASNLPGPNVDEILHASPGAFQKWTHPEGSEVETPIHKLPVHTRNVEYLRELCKEIGKHTGGRVEATVTCSEPKPVLPAVQRRSLKGLITNVCVSGDGESVQKMRARILNQTPIALVSLARDLGIRHLLTKTRNVLLWI